MSQILYILYPCHKYTITILLCLYTLAIGSTLSTNQIDQN